MKSLVRKMWARSPTWLKATMRPFLHLLRWVIFLVKFKFPPPPLGTDLVGYESLLKILEEHDLLKVDGNIVEIGVFLGGGTYKLAKYLERKGSSKKIYVIDIFNILADQTQCTCGIHMADLYEGIMKSQGKGLSQFDIFQEVTKACKNVEVIKGDSKVINLRTTSVSFAFIDGNHDPSYVTNDFYLVWPKLAQRGVIAFHDYGYDLPQVTKTIDDLLSKHKGEFEEAWVDEEQHIIYIKRTI